jgi:hypothetical protein
MRDRLVLPIIGLVSTLVVLIVGFLLLGRQTEIQRGYDVSALRRHWECPLCFCSLT